MIRRTVRPSIAVSRRVRALAPVAGLAVAIVVAATGASGGPPPSATPARPAKTLDDYRQFRIASIDLLGRMPTRSEIDAFEKPAFDLDKWIDARTQGPTYVERLTRIYMDLLRLEPNLNFSTGPAQLYRHPVQTADGKVFVYYRQNQRRQDPATDGEFCFSPDEIGQHVRPNANVVGTAKPITKKLLDARTVLVRPWWLYRDYKSNLPSKRYGQGWSDPDVQYRPVESLLLDADGKTQATDIRVCKEEAQKIELGHVYVSGRTKNVPNEALVGGRTKPPPLDKPYATAHKGDAVSCDTRLALESSIDCGCGVGLERCMPADGNGAATPAFYFPNNMPLGPTLPLDVTKQRADRWFPYWWSREAVEFLDDLFESDRDFREILTGKHTFVNGPLAQYYRTIQRTSCCGPETNFGMTEETTPLFDPKKAPADLLPHDVTTWRMVPDRGPRAAGILTTPMFLQKYASARARGAVLYNAFLCKSFIAENAQLMPSEEPNLMKRDGCKTCHAALEPLAAFFARIEPSSSVFLPVTNFPVVNPSCKKDKNGKIPGNCNALYDAAFADAAGATLRSAYGSLPNADASPAGAGQEITKTPEFSRCAVQRVTSSFLGRPTTPDDAPLLESLDKTFVASGYKMRALVKGIVRSPEYRKANNLSSVGSANAPPLVQNVHGGAP